MRDDMRDNRPRRNDGNGPRRNDGNGPRGNRPQGGGFNRGGFQSSEPREMHKATCGDCGTECEVPFKPREDRPVYCRDCFAKHKPRRF